ncbi:Thioredoxin domain-containing protein 3 [Kappamyces sp. JEL0680]|nr:Thioredoxin domain-containing protein 3 [Kappamyces sp. JEL0680]
MSAGAKKTEIPLPSLLIADDEWERHLQKTGLRGNADQPSNVQSSTCLLQNGILVKVIRGANAPLLEKIIKDQLEIEKSGGTHKPVLLEAGSEIINPLPETRSVAALVIAAEEEAAKSLLSSTTAASSESPASPSKDTETFALIKPDAMKPALIETILEKIRYSRFHVAKMKKFWLTQETVGELYKEHIDKPFFPSLVTYFTSGPCLGLVLSKENAVEEWRKLIGPANSQQAKENAPQSLRALFGTDNRINAVFGSDSQESADREKELFFGPESKVPELPITDDEISIKSSPGSQKTLCIIKSEDTQVRESIIERIICRGIEIFKRDELKLDAARAEELFPGVSQENLEFLTKWSHLALILKGENVVNAWKEMAGPEDPADAKNSAPNSLRALFGVDAVKNAVHASSNAERALHETNVLFPHALERGGSVVLRDSRIGTSANPFPPNHQMSMEELHAKLERTVALIKPDAYGTGKKDLIVDKILANGFTIVKEEEMQMSLAQAQEFYKEHQTKPFYDELISWMSGTPIYAMVLEKEGAIGAWRELAGPTNSVKAKEIAPNSIRAIYGTDGSHNAVHGSDAPISAEREIKVLFGTSVSPTPEPLPGSQPANATRKESLTAPTASTKSAENVLSQILASDPAPEGNAPERAGSVKAPSSRPGSTSNLSKRTGSAAGRSLNNLSRSVPKLSGSKPSLSKPASASKLSSVSTSKLTSSNAKLSGSKAGL